MVRSREEKIRIIKAYCKELKEWWNFDWERDRWDFVFLMLLLLTASTPLIAVLLYISNSQPI